MYIEAVKGLCKPAIISVLLYRLAFTTPFPISAFTALCTIHYITIRHIIPPQSSSIIFVVDIYFVLYITSFPFFCNFVFKKSFVENCKYINLNYINIYNIKIVDRFAINRLIVLLIYWSARIKAVRCGNVIAK